MDVPGKICELARLVEESQIVRRDGDYLRRFLVGHQYDVQASLKALENYQSFVGRRKRTWLNVKSATLRAVLQSQVFDVLDNQGLLDQKVVWIRMEKWDPQTFSADDILETAGLLCEAIYAKTNAIEYIDIIIDLNDFHFQHLYALSPRFAKRMVFFMAECLPMNMLNIYVVRQPRYFFLLYALFKPFISEKMRRAIHICGCDYDLLKENIGAKNLPREYDGNALNKHTARWLQFLYKPKTIEHLHEAGYELH